MSDLDVTEDSPSMSSKSSASSALEESRKEYSWRSDSREFQLSDHDPLHWNLVTQTRELESHELDWLLIPLKADDLNFENRVHFQGRDIYLQGVTNKVPDDTVILATGRSGSRLLKASSTLSGIYIPFARQFLRTWSIFHEDIALTDGDSGSWVINESGEVYGSLVGTNEGSGVSHVAPMVTTVAAICQRNRNAEVSFPSRRSDPRPSNVSAPRRDSFSQPYSVKYGISTNQSFRSKQNPRMSQNDTSQKLPFNLLPRASSEKLSASGDLPILGSDPRGQTDIGSAVAHMGSAVRVKSYEDHHGRDEVTKHIASIKKSGSLRSTSFGPWQLGTTGSGRRGRYVIRDGL